VSKHKVLLKVELDILPSSKCNDTYYTQDANMLKHGILPDSMICAGSYIDGADSCDVRFFFSDIGVQM